LFYLKINDYYNNLIQDNWFAYTFVIPNNAQKFEIIYYYNTINFNNEINFDSEQYTNCFDVSIYDLNNKPYYNNGLAVQFILEIL